MPSLDYHREAPADDLLAIYAQSLLSRLSDAIRVPLRNVVSDDWSPTPNDCHDNAEKWVELNQGWTVVHGWLVFDLRVTHGHVDLLPHSVVRSPNGDLVDVTPLDPRAPKGIGVFPFLIHLGAATQFQHFVANYPIALLRVRIETEAVSFVAELSHPGCQI
jgi:hypothetical protein